MVQNFKIQTHQTNGNLLLKLKRDFDGSSAFELINILNSQYGKVKKIVVDKSGLGNIHPFGMDVFLKNCNFKGKPSNVLYFTGKYANSMEILGGNFAC